MLRRGVRKEGDSGFAQHLCSCARRYVPGWRVAKYLVSHDCLWSRQKKKRPQHSLPKLQLTFFSGGETQGARKMEGCSLALSHPSSLTSFITLLRDYNLFLIFSWYDPPP